MYSNVYSYIIAYGKSYTSIINLNVDCVSSAFRWNDTTPSFYRTSLRARSKREFQFVLIKK